MMGAARKLLLALFIAAHVAPVAGSGLMRKERQKKEPKTALRASFEALLGDDASERIFAIEQSLRPTYEAFPKNQLGHIPVREIFPAMVRGYFAKEQGWLIKGLEPPRIREDRTELQGAEILRDKAPALVSALDEMAEADRGLSLSDVVGVVAAMEHLVIGEVAQLLRPAYMYNNAEQSSILDKDAVEEILESYLLLLRHGAPYNWTDIEGHRHMKERAKENLQSWAAISAFLDRAKAKVPEKDAYGYDDMLVMAKEIALRFGEWQNWECKEMKAVLMSLEQEPGNGRVPFTTFQSQPSHAVFQFTEPEEYLTNTGSLDGEDVLVANYVLGPSNCIASSQYFSVCCLNECESIMSDLERKTQSPVWPADQVITLLEETPSSTREAGQALLEDAVNDVAAAAEDEGSVRLHSGKFGNLLHKIYPNECPRLSRAESLAEDVERSVALEWEQLQQQCTRVPDWHKRSEEM